MMASSDNESDPADDSADEQASGSGTDLLGEEDAADDSAASPESSIFGDSDIHSNAPDAGEGNAAHAGVMSGSVVRAAGLADSASVGDPAADSSPESDESAETETSESSDSPAGEQPSSRVDLDESDAKNDDQVPESDLHSGSSIFGGEDVPLSAGGLRDADSETLSTTDGDGASDPEVDALSDFDSPTEPTTEELPAVDAGAEHAFALGDSDVHGDSESASSTPRRSRSRQQQASALPLIIAVLMGPVTVGLGYLVYQSFFVGPEEQVESESDEPETIPFRKENRSGWNRDARDSGPPTLTFDPDPDPPPVIERQPDSNPKPSLAEQERTAARKLKLAIRLEEEQPEAAADWYDEILRDFPETEAARQAKIRKAIVDRILAPQ